MDITTYLASLWGPVLVAVGLGIFTSRSYYATIYRDLEKCALAVLIFGMVAIAAGIAQIQAHNMWDTMPQIVVSLLGWGLVAKGALFAVAPTFVDRAGDQWANLKMIPVAGGLTLIVGGYLSYIAYLM